MLPRVTLLSSVVNFRTGKWRLFLFFRALAKIQALVFGLDFDGNPRSAIHGRISLEYCLSLSLLVAPLVLTALL